MPEIIKINVNTWRFEDGFVRFFLLEGKDKAVMIDSGVNCQNAREIASSLTDKPIILLNTHGDGDHISGSAAFNDIYMHKLDYINCEINVRFPDISLVEVNDGGIIDLGDRPLKIIHIPGHTKGSIAILDINNRALYAGDSVQKGHIYMFGKHREPDKFENSLDKLISMANEYDCIYASHDEYKVSGDYASKVKAAWLDVINGKVDYEMIDLFGNQVKSYTTKDCGFFVQ